MPSNNRDFANYCCELLVSVGPVVVRRMFGGWGLSTDGLTIAIVTNLGSGDKLWLKASEETRGKFEAAGCGRFTYDMRQGTGGDKVARSMNYYMAPWARLALEAALAKRQAAPTPAPAKRRVPKAGTKKSQG